MSARPGEELLLSQVVLGLFTAAVSGLLIYLLWGRFGLPEAPGPPYWSPAPAREGLRAFAALGLPLVVSLPSVVLAVLIRLLGEGREALARRARFLDAATYLLLPVALLSVVLWGNLGNGLAALGLIFLGVVTLKALILARLLWAGLLRPEAREDGGLGPRRKAAAFLVAWMVLAAAAAWTGQVSPPLAGETGFTAQAAALAAGRVAPGAGLYAHLAAPLFALGGRMALVLAQAGLAALLAVVLLAWLDRAGVRPGPAAASVGLVLLSAPVLFATQMLGPLTLAMLLAAAGVYLIGREPGWGAVGGLAVLSLALGLLGTALIAPALCLALWGLGRALSRRAMGPALAAALAAAIMACMGLWSLGLWPAGWSAPWGAVLTPWAGGDSGPRMVRTLGVAWSAPVMLLALAGLPAALRRLGRPAAAALTVGAAYAAWLLAGGAPLGPAGPGLPGGPLAAVLPLAALFLAPALSALNRPWLRLVAGCPAALGLAFTWLLCLAPPLRFAPAAGGGALAAAVDARLNINLEALLPIAPPPSPAPAWWLGGLAGAALVLAVYVWLAGRRPAGEAGPWTVNEVMAMALCCGCFLAALLAAGALMPPGA